MAIGWKWNVWGDRNPESWRDYQESAKARGEDLGIEAWLPPQVDDDQNLFTHPWMRALFAGRGAELVQAADYATIHEMAARPRAWAGPELTKGLENGFAAWAGLTGLGPMLWHRAAGAIYAGNEAIAVDDLEALFRLGAHFRSQNFFLSQVVGATMEIRAVQMMENGARKKIFSPASQQRLHRARRRRPLEDEITATLRVERGICLKSLESFPKRPRRGLHERLSAAFYDPERAVAANSLYLCEVLDSALSSPDLAEWRDFSRRIKMRFWTRTPGPPLAMAGKMLGIFGMVLGGLLIQEKETDRVFKLLGP